METTLTTHGTNVTPGINIPAGWLDGNQLTNIEPMTGVDFVLRCHTACTAGAGRVVRRWDGTLVIRSASGVVWQVAEVARFRVTSPAERGQALEDYFVGRMTKAERIRQGYECLGCGALLPGGLAAGWPRQRCNGCRK